LGDSSVSGAPGGSNGGAIGEDGRGQQTRVDRHPLPPNPESGVHLPRLLRSAGAVDIRVEVRPIVITSLATFRAMRNPDAVLTYLVMRRQVEADRAAAFLADLETRDREGAFVATSIIYVVSGRKAPD
jgi:hypothetical protein